MRKITLMFFSLLFCLSVGAESVVTVKRVSHGELSQLVSKLGKMTFDNGQVTVYSLAGEVLYSEPITEETTIVISEDNAKIGEEEFALETLIENTSSDVSFRVYTIDGHFVSNTMVGSLADVIGTLSCGTYILVGQNKIFKIRK